MADSGADVGELPDSAAGDSTLTDTGARDSALVDGRVPDSAIVAGDAATDAPPSCVEGMVRCGALGLEDCVGGEFVAGDACPLGCDSAVAPRCLELTPSNVDGSLFVATGEIRIDSDTRWETGDCAALPGSPQTVAQSGYPSLCVVRTARFIVEAGARLDVRGNQALVILASEFAHVEGEIDVSADGRRAGPGGSGPTTSTAPTGAGNGAAGVDGPGNTDGGGGGGGLCGDGGDGGNADGTSGGAGGAAPGAAWDLSPLRGGWGGGLGGAGQSAGRGGAGGGAVQISVRGELILSGPIYAGGGRGERGKDGTRDDHNIGAGGGGGSGGAVLLEAESVVFSGGGVVQANGAGGAGAASCRTAGDASDGSDGRDHPSRPPGGAQGPTCGADYGSNGGDGGGIPIAGENGESHGSSGGNGGGGGGGAGCVLIRTPTGTPPAGIGATSPDAAPGLRAATVIAE